MDFSTILTLIGGAIAAIFGAKLFGKSQYNKGRKEQAEDIGREAEHARRAIGLVDQVAREEEHREIKEARDQAKELLGRPPSVNELKAFLRRSRK